MEFRRPGLIARLAVPFKGTGQRFALASLIFAALGLMLTDRGGVAVVERFRTTIADVATPILDAVARPVAATDKAIAHLRELAALRDENIRLKEEVGRLRGWHGVALQYANENVSFRNLLNFKGPRRKSFVTARVIADGRGPFIKSVLVNAGRSDRVAKGQAVTTTIGMVGRISEAGEHSARVLILTDLNSRVPVVIAENRTRAILAGDNSERPQIVFLPENTNVEVGQRIVTSGHGGVFPPGIGVGQISSVENGVIRVRPFVELSKLEYLQIVDYENVLPPEGKKPGQKSSKKPSKLRKTR
ncbi:MAG: rod shape-determining protein MreC [Rhodospirillales bacterium]|jgi:rod shape-determining protein MreC|nr:rod shape-determining protein MreC [Rhodospirillales bacterium]MBT4007615.1 rod shape-determining protein MreC [Rhodospirillales bacterium]MBT5075728.1 rod shape-determining protein MreC [Rhodospirillales bacterium]MBT5113725.1 rod shape-determining protein MreC [Rhodospirillales bacterium]MBT5674027.1 rod shape-determining protein MreC [Rhodospirillales bacterium]